MATEIGIEISLECGCKVRMLRDQSTGLYAVDEPPEIFCTPNPSKAHLQEVLRQFERLLPGLKRVIGFQGHTDRKR